MGKKGKGIKEHKLVVTKQSREGQHRERSQQYDSNYVYGARQALSLSRGSIVRYRNVYAPQSNVMLNANCD